MKKIFIISPYNHEDPAVVEERAKQAVNYFVYLLNKGDAPVSVIASCHHLIASHSLNTSFSFWEDYCYEMMKDVDEVHVLCLEGWEFSEGVMLEIQKANDLEKIISYIPSWFLYDKILAHEKDWLKPDP